MNITEIQGNDGLGKSRNTINNNFKALDEAQTLIKETFNWTDKKIFGVLEAFINNIRSKWIKTEILESEKSKTKTLEITGLEPDNENFSLSLNKGNFQLGDSNSKNTINGNTSITGTLITNPYNLDANLKLTDTATVVTDSNNLVRIVDGNKSTFQVLNFSQWHDNTNQIRRIKLKIDSQLKTGQKLIICIHNTTDINNKVILKKEGILNLSSDKIINDDVSILEFYFVGNGWIMC